MLGRSPMVWMKYNIATWTKGRMFDFGYTPEELRISSGPRNDGDSVGGEFPKLTMWGGVTRPQTTAFSLCDSPVGLLAGMLDTLHTRPTTSLGPLSRTSMTRPRSPFLDPEELEMEERQNSQASTGGRIGNTAARVAGANGGEGEFIWSPTDLLNWTMMQWLPGPEASLVSLFHKALSTFRY